MAQTATIRFSSAQKVLRPGIIDAMLNDATTIWSGLCVVPIRDHHNGIPIVNGNAMGMGQISSQLWEREWECEETWVGAGIIHGK